MSIDKSSYIYEDPAVMTELQEIDRVLAQALDALESDADTDQRRRAFESIQDLYQTTKMMGSYPRPAEED